MNSIDPSNLIIVCVTIIAALKIIVEFIKFLIKRNDPPEVKATFVDELISQETYFEIGDQEPYFKRLYKRTWSNGDVEYVTSED